FVQMKYRRRQVRRACPDNQRDAAVCRHRQHVEQIVTLRIAQLLDFARHAGVDQGIRATANRKLRDAREPGRIGHAIVVKWRRQHGANTADGSRFSGCGCRHRTLSLGPESKTKRIADTVSTLRPSVNTSALFGYNSYLRDLRLAQGSPRA